MIAGRRSQCDEHLDVGRPTVKCVTSNAETTTVTKNVLTYGALVVFVALYERNHGSSFTLAVVAAMAVGLLGLVAVHELGHAVAAVCTRTRLFEISVGSGRPLGTFRVRGCRIRLRRSLFGGGHVIALGTKRRGYRTRRCLTLAAGVGAEWLALGVFWRVHVRLANEATVGIVGSEQLLALLAIFVVAGTFESLIPQTLPNGVPNDGAQILATLRMSSGDVDQAVRDAPAHALHIEMSELAETGRIEETLTLTESLDGQARAEPTAAMIHCTGLIVLGRYEEARDLARTLRENTRHEADYYDDHLASIDNILAYCLCAIGDEETLGEARTLAELAYRQIPAPSVAGTLGGALVLTGEPERGLALLELSRPEILADADVVETQRLLTIGHLARRDIAQARLEFGRGLDAPGDYRGRLVTLLCDLGAAEAVLWLDQLRLGWLPDPTVVGESGQTIALSLSAWQSPDLDDDARWQLYSDAGGVGRAEPDELLQLSRFVDGLRAAGSTATETAR